MKKVELVVFLVIFLLGSTTGRFKWGKFRKSPKQLHHHHHHHYVHHIHHLDHEDGEDKPQFVGDAQENHHFNHEGQSNEEVNTKTPQKVYVVDKNLHQKVKYGYFHLMEKTSDSSQKNNDDNNPKIADSYPTQKPITNDIFPTTPKPNHSNSPKDETESAKKGLYTDVTYYNYFYLEPEEKVNFEDHIKDHIKEEELSAVKKQSKIIGDENDFKYYTKKGLDEDENEAILKANSWKKPLYYKNGDEEYKIIKILEVDFKNGKPENVEPKVLYSIDHSEQNGDKMDDSNNKKEEKTDDSYSKSYTEIWK